MRIEFKTLPPTIFKYDGGITSDEVKITLTGKNTTTSYCAI